MLQDLCQPELNRCSYKLIFPGIFMCFMVIAPIHSIMKAIQYHSNYQQFMQKLSNGPSDDSSQVPLQQFLRLFSRNPYRGKWQSSLLRSKLLEEEEGLMELKSKRLQNEGIQTFGLSIKIFDGFYRQNSFYDITVPSNSFIPKQRFETGKIIYQSSPLIAYYRKGYIIHSKSQQPLYLNKIKFKVSCKYSQNDFTTQPQYLTIEFLLSSEYSINLIGRSIDQYQQTFHDLLFTLILIGISGLQLNGIYNIYKNISLENQYRERFSIFGLLSASGLDFIIALVLAYICFQSEKKFAIYSFPAFILWAKLIYIDFRILLHIINYRNQTSLGKTNLQIYLFFGILSLFIYSCNLNGFSFIVVSNLIIFPQVWRNYIIGHKLKSNLNNYFMIALPRYLIIIYLRFYKYNAFDLKTNLSVCIACTFFIVIQVLLIIAQMKYGVRSILPKIIHPVEFQYFMSQKEDDDSTCSICILSLKEKSPQKGDSSALFIQQFYTKIVETPCHHKFHSECLLRWMQTRLQCPNCRQILPPIQEDQ